MVIQKKELEILIVEDNPGDYILICDYLKEVINFVSITQAKTCLEALKILSSGKPFDAVILDLTLPDSRGEELVRDMMKHKGESLILVLTGFSDRNFGVKALSLGVDDYLLKDELTASQLYKSIAYSLERQKNSQELRLSKEKYQSLFQISPIPTWIFDKNSTEILDANQAAITQYGYSKEDFLQMSVFDLLPAADRAAFKDAFKANTPGHDLYKNMSRHVKKGGEVIFTEVQSSVIEFGDFQTGLLLAIDVTDKLKAQESLHLNEQRLKALVQDGSDLISVLDAHGNYTYVSPTSKTILGHSVEEFSGRNMFDFVHPEDLHRVIRQFDLLKHKKRVYISPFRFMDHESNWRWIETYLTNLMNDPAVHGIVANSKDISQHVRLERILKESNERYEAVARATSDAIWDYTLNDNKLYVLGTGYKNMFGYNFTNRYVDWEEQQALIHIEDKARVADEFKKAIDNRKNTEHAIEYRFLKADGQYAYVRNRFSVVYENEEPKRLLGAIQDITRQKKEEQEREKLITELTHINENLRQFSYITSHNLRGPIANLLGLTNLIDEKKVQDDSLQMVLKGIKKAAFKFDETIKDLLKVLVIKDNLSIQIEELEFDSSLNNVKSQISLLIEEAKATVESDFHEAPLVLFNRSYLDSIMLNMLTNALRYRSPLRKLHVRIKSVEENGWIVLTVQDNGIGMNLALYKDKVFGLYQKFHDHPDSKGLGLFLVKSQMEALGGKISLESQVNEGTTFILKFKK